MKKHILLLLGGISVAFLLLFALGCKPKRGGNTATNKTIVVGGKNYTEQYIINEMVALILEKEGFKVKRNMGLASFPLRKGMESGQIDIYTEYTGTAWATYLKESEMILEPDKLFAEVKKRDEANGLIWLRDFNVNNTYALAVTKEMAEENSLETLSDLSAYVNQNPDTVIAMEQEFASRSDGIAGMAEVYGMNYKKSMGKVMEVGLTFEALSRGEAQVSEVYSTDGKLKKYDLIVLEDDKKFFPPYVQCPVIRKETLNAYPEIEEIMGRISDTLILEDMINLNYQVDAEGKEPIDVARDYLGSKGLL